MYRSGNSVKDVPTRPADRYLLPVEVEHRLGISPTTRRRWTNRGLLRAYPLGPHYQPGPGGNRNGSRVRYSEHEVNDLFERIRHGALAVSPRPLGG
jgi:predicted site-specific integrase-resolvase